MYFVKSNIIESLIAPPDMHVPAHLAVIDKLGLAGLLRATKCTIRFTSSLCLG